MRFAEPRLFGVASRNSQDGSKNRGRAQQSNCGQDQRSRGKGNASDELSPIVPGARASPSPNRTRACGSGCDYGAGARHGRDADKVSNDWAARAGRTARDVGWRGRSSLCTCHAKPQRFCCSWQVCQLWQVVRAHSGTSPARHSLILLLFYLRREMKLQELAFRPKVHSSVAYLWQIGSC